MILGVLLFICMSVGASGPVLAGRIFDITGSYQLAFSACAGLSVIILALAILLTPTRRQDLTSQKELILDEE